MGNSIHFVCTQVKTITKKYFQMLFTDFEGKNMTSLAIIIPWSRHPIPVKKSVSKLKGWGRREPSTHTHTATTHPKSAFNIFKTPSREVCWPPGRRSLSVVSEIEKGKSLHFQQEKAKQRSHRWRRNSTGFSLSDKKGGGTVRRSWWRRGQQQGGVWGWWQTAFTLSASR